MIWLILAIVAGAVACALWRKQADPDLLLDNEAEFRRRFPGRCPRCSYNRWARQMGQPVCEREHDCVEKEVQR